MCKSPNNNLSNKTRNIEVKPYHCCYCCVHKLSTSIYDLVLKYVCHFHHHFLLQLPLVKFDHYRDTRASILDPCIQGIFYQKFSAFCMIHFNCMTHFRTNNFQQRNCFWDCCLLYWQPIISNCVRGVLIKASLSCTANAW